MTIARRQPIGWIVATALLGAVLFIAAGSVLITMRGKSMRAELVHSVERAAVSSVTLLAHALRVAPISLVQDHDPREAWPSDLKLDRERIELIDGVIRRLGAVPGVAKVKLFNREGRTIYSPISREIGQLESNNAKFIARALAGEAAGQLAFRERFNGMDGVRENVWIVETHLPIRFGPETGDADAVVELYSDVSAEFSRLQEVAEQEAGTLLLMLGILYAAMMGLVLTSQRFVMHALRRAQRSEAKLRDAIESMRDGLLLWDPDDRLSDWNTRCLELLPYAHAMLRQGLPFAEYIGAAIERNHGDLSPAQRAARVEQRIAQHARPDPRDSVEFTVGERVVELREERTARGGCVSVFRDVTNERVVDRRLRESEAQFRDGIESMVDAFCLFDREQRVVHWNARFLAAFPYLAPHLRAGMTMRDLFERHAEAPEIGIAQAERASWIDKAVSWSVVPTPEGFLRRLADGRSVLVTVSATALGGVIHVVRDVTAETAAKQALASNEALFRAAIANMADGLSLWDAEDRLILWNRAWSDLFPKHEALRESGRPFRDLARITARDALPDASDAEREAWVEARCRQRASGVSKIELTTVSGRIIEVVERRTEEGALVGVYRDVTEQRLATERIATALEREREAMAQQKRFVSIAAHEFRTPLTIIDGAAQRLQRTAAQIVPDDLRERAQTIRTAAARMTQLVDTTLDLARVDAGRIELNLTEVDLVALLDAVCRRQHGISPGFSFALRADAKPIAVRGDGRLLDHVFTNLVGNAVKYSGTSRRIEVTLRRDDRRTSIVVRDFGIGIPRDEIPKLFTRFFRASTAKGISGTGIGLNLVRELLALHGGDVLVESEVGQGTVVTVNLPRSVATASTNSAA